MRRLVSIDGGIRAPEEATVSVYDRGFLYGDSVFETIRTYRGEPFALDEHLARLARSAERVAIAMPIPTAALADEVRRVIAAAREPGPLGEAPRGELSARIMITRGAGPLGLDPGLAGAPLRVILVEPITPLPAALYRDGVSVVTVRTERAGDAAHGAKVGNYLASLLALREARARGAHEALILDAAGQVVEGTTSNVFLVEPDAAAPGAAQLVTPPESAGILVGITRAHVLEIAAELGLRVRLEPIAVARIAAADEVFITSSIREIVPVVRVDDRTMGAGVPGPTTRALHAAFRKRVGLGGEPLPWEAA